MRAIKDPDQPQDLKEALRECEERLQYVMEQSSVLYWEQDKDCRFTLITSNALGESGIDPQTSVGKARWEDGTVPVDDGGDWGRHRAILEARLPFTDFVYKRVNPTGEQRYISTSGTPMFDGSKRFRGYRGTARDITQKVQMALRLAIEHAVTRVLEESASITEAAPLIIRVICESLGWSCGAHWVPDDGGKALRCAETWGGASAGIGAFLETTRQLAPSTQPGGLNRRAWSQRNPTWIPDVTQDPTFRRAPDALKAGLHSAFAFPINVGAHVFGVMEFFSREAHQPDAELLDCMTYVGSQIGQFARRRQTEEELRRFRAALDASADMVVLIDRATMRFVDVNETTCKLLGYSREELLQMGPQDILPVSREELERAYDAFIANPSEVEGMRSQYRCKDGSLLAFESTRRVLRSGNSDIIAAISRDTSVREREEKLLKLEHTVTRSLSEANSASEAITAAIQAVCENEGWECGRYFQVDEKAGLLRFAASWGVEETSIQKFLEASREIVRQPGVGLTGYVWQTGEPLWVPDVTKDPRAKHAAFTVNLGIRGGFHFPVVSEGKTIGVISFNSREVREPEDRLLRTIGVIGSQIGQFISRKQAEDELQRFRTAMDASADLMFLIDPVPMRYIDVNDAACRILGYTREELFTMGPQDILSNSREELAGLYERIFAGELDELTTESVYQCKDGSRFEIEAFPRAMRSANGNFIVVVARAVGKRKREEQLRKLEHTVTRALAEADSVSAAIKAAIQAVCETEGWECGRYFRPDDKTDLLHLGEAWGVPNAAISRYIEGSWDLTYEPGVGLVGRVWQTGQPLWVADLYADPRVSQGPRARESGIRGAFVIPIAAQGKTIGVIAFNSREVREPQERLLQAISVIGSQIGQFISRKMAEDVVRESEERFRSLTELSSDLYWEQDDQFRFTSMQGSGSARVGAANTVSIGGTRWEQRYVNMTATDWAAHIALLEAHQPFRDLELSRLDSSGNKIWISVSGTPVFDASGAFKGYRGVGKDITERKRVEERIEHMANHDALTTLPNRLMFSEMLNLSLQNAQRYHRHFAVLFIDLDRFKLINDTLGHEAGDQLLQEMGRRLTNVVRTSDVVARLGGDEFVVLIQEVGETRQVEAVAQKILSAIITPMIIQEQECRVTASIGICMYPADAQDEQSLMKNADIAMYRAKEEGKNTYKFYSKDFNIHSFERLALETSLRRGLERNEFFLHYQAKLDLNSRQITGVEALVRWQHPDLGMVPPVQFIPLAEETGLIVPIGKWVLDTACAQNMEWQRAGLPPLRMAVNLSARQFADDNLLQHISDALRKSGMPAELLELELTESMVMQNADRAGEVLASIKLLGVRLAIDDFGVGYSSLTHLKRFPIDTLKVDRSFIRDLPQNSEDRAITSAIIAMGRSLNLKVVAEGVETLEQEDFLRDHDCDESQGYYFSKPITGDRFADLLRDHLASKK